MVRVICIMKKLGFVVIALKTEKYENEIPLTQCPNVSTVRDQIVFKVTTLTKLGLPETTSRLGSRVDGRVFLNTFVNSLRMLFKPEGQT